MQQPSRKFQAGTVSYRYSINGQEKETELNNNITTALYWEYDSRIGKRWNLDPKPEVSISPYNCFKGNPIRFNDPLGDTTPVYDSKGKYLNTIYDRNPLQVLVLNSKYDKTKAVDKLKGLNLPLLKDQDLSDRLYNAYSKLGITYETTPIRDFYKNWSKAFPIKTVDRIPVKKGNIKVNGKPYLKPLYAESILYLTVEKNKVVFPNKPPTSTGDLIRNDAGTDMKIHPHIGLGKIFSFTINGSPYNIYSEDGPSSADRERVSYRQTYFKEETRDIVVDENAIHIYNSNKDETITIIR